MGLRPASPAAGHASSGWPVGPAVYTTVALQQWAYGQYTLLWHCSSGPVLQYSTAVQYCTAVLYCSTGPRQYCSTVLYCSTGPRQYCSTVLYCSTGPLHYSTVVQWASTVLQYCSTVLQYWPTLRYRGRDMSPRIWPFGPVLYYSTVVQWGTTVLQYCSASRACARARGMISMQIYPI